MSETVTLARPYARAVFSMAREQARMPQWSAMLGFASRAAAEPAVHSLLGDPRVDAQALAELLAPPGETDAGFAQFLAVLADNQRLVLLPEIAALFDLMRSEHEQVVKATITSATALDEAEVGRLRDALRKRFGGRTVEVTTAVDAALIGGAIIDAGDVVIDGSLRTKLSRLGAALAN